MNFVRASSWLHKWLALVIGIQMLFWVVSGLFFAVFPIERVRSEHRVEQAEVAPLTLTATASDVAALLPEAPTRLSFERAVDGRAVAIAEFAERRPVLIDVEGRRILSPLDEAAATAIARAHVGADFAVREARLVTEASPEYRGALPAWRIAFEDGEGLAVYVAADTGRVTARRSDLWRVYDALWALHIMDWRDHENFNNGLLILASAMSLVMTIVGFVLIPYRLLPRRR
jgi:uncharacterized iron-regulated membrane protein